MTILKDAVEDAFNLLGVGYKEMSLDDIALEIQDKNSDYKEYDLDLLRKQISSFMANATTKIVKGKRVINKDSKFERVKNGKGGFKKGFYKLRKPKQAKVPKPKPLAIDPSPELVGSDNTLYIGSAGEMSVCSELLFREYNVSRMSVDDGVDIVAIKKGKTYYIQVKTVLVKSKNFAIKINEKSFEKYSSNDCYYIVVARTSKEGVPFNQYIVLTANTIRYLQGSGYIKSSNGTINIGFSQEGGHLFIKEFKIDQMLNCFDLLK